MKRQYVSARQRKAEVVRAIKRLTKQGKVPTVRAIAAEVGLKSPGSVQRYLHMLCLDEVIRFDFKTGHYAVIQPQHREEA